MRRRIRARLKSLYDTLRLVALALLNAAITGASLWSVFIWLLALAIVLFPDGRDMRDNPPA